jgi:hypothetical protein
MTVRCDVDCEAGRRLGCQTYCCRLLVRLEEDERVESDDGTPTKGFVDKDEDGYCIHFDRETKRCRIWQHRPRICRSYDCNSDDLLQIAIRQRFRTIVDLVKAAMNTLVPKETYIHIPYCGESDDHPGDRHD